MTAGRRSAFWGFVAALAVLALLAPPSALAKQTHLFFEVFGPAAKPMFGEPGTLGGANGLAVDHSTGDLLVIDSRVRTVSRWKADGTPSPFAALGTNVIDGKGGGECPAVPADCDETPEEGLSFTTQTGEQQVTVDSSGTLTDGNIYVTQGTKDAGRLIDIFSETGDYLGQLTGYEEEGEEKLFSESGVFTACGVAVDPTGDLFVAGGREDKIYKYDPAANPPVNGDHVATFETKDWPEEEFEDPPPVCNLAAGAEPSAGALFANTFFTFDGNSVVKLDASSGEVQYIVEPGEARLVGVDPASGHVFTVGAGEGLLEYDAAGSSGASQVSSSSATGNGLAVDGEAGRVYLSQNNSIRSFGPLVIVPDATTEAAEITGDTSLRLKGTVDPDGEPLTECFFEYGTTTAYGQTAPCVPGAGEIAPGGGPTAVSAEIGGLEPETLYHFRLIAKNANAALYPDDSNSVARGANRSIRTPGAPAIKGAWAQDVITAEARLRATINPENSPTSYRFEWGLEAGPPYENASAAIEIGAGEEDRTVSLSLGDLSPATTYHWRVVAENGIGVAESPDRVFTTFALPPPPPHPDPCPNAVRRAGSGAQLPDCRAYELVSPLDKGGADIVVRQNVEGDLTGIHQSAPGGERLVYSSYQAFGDARGAPWSSQYLASRDEARGEWATHGISLPRGPLVISANQARGPEFRAVSDDLCTGWARHDTALIHDEDAVPGFANLYRVGGLCGAEDSYEAITIAEPSLEPRLFFPNLQGHAGGGRYALFRVNDALAVDRGPAAAGGGNYQCYGAEEEQLVLISVLPGGAANKSHCSVGTASPSLSPSRNERLDSAVSGDGARVYWTGTSGFDGRGPGRLFVRLNGFASGAECAGPGAPCTVELAPGLSEGQFWAARPDGEAALFTNGDLNAGGADLYRFEAETGEASPIAGGVWGLLGASEDLARAYLVSGEDLDAGATAGAPNLYLYEAGEGEGEGAGSFRFLATLSGEDVRAGTVDFTDKTNTDRRLRGVPTPVNVNPRKHSAQVSPDGETVAFMSTAPLTGYDNLDANSGEPDAEVFRYDAEANGGAGELRCVSCNPSGGRPAGRSIGESSPAKLIWAAAQLPLPENQFHVPRALSEDGRRLFFESYEALALRDTNGMRDVYQWEAPGKGGCAEAHRDFSPPAGGCVSLISSGESPADSDFVDASADGRDVFFKTAASLLPHDPGLVDVYDARVEGGLPPPGSPRPPCEGEACQSPPPAPEAPTPATATHRGAGDLPPPPRNCAASARRAKRLAQRARRLRRAAARARQPRRARAKGRRATAVAKRAGRLSAKAKRCRRARAARRAGR